MLAAVTDSDTAVDLLGIVPKDRVLGGEVIGAESLGVESVGEDQHVRSRVLRALKKMY